MANLAILSPARLSAARGDSESATRATTRNPKEAWIIPPRDGAYVLDVDLGSEQRVDTFYLGYVIAAPGAGQYWAVQQLEGYGTGAVLSTPVAGTPLADGLGLIGSHCYAKVAPVTGRYFRIIVGNPPGAPIAAVGVVAMGLSYVAQWGHEFGSGRTIGDTSIVERLFGGAFGIDEGVTFGGYQWTFGDLSADEVQRLWAMVRRLGIARTVLVVEDPDRTAGLNDRIHWGLFERLEPYERIDPANSRWSFKIQDWA